MELMHRLTSDSRGPGPRWASGTGRLVTAAIVLAAALLVFGGFYISLPWSSQASAYLTDRNVGLAALTLTLLILRSTRPLAWVLLASALIHVLDGVVDVPTGDYGGVAGSLVFAFISAAAAVWLLRPGAVDDAT